ncbi:ROK family protein [bacterium]|nr:ROK family protein [bacterium]
MLLGLDVGGTKCAAILGDATPSVIARREWPSRAERGPEAMIADLLANATALMEENGRARAVGVAIGGPLDAGRGVIESPPNLPGWSAVPLGAIVGERLGLPVRVEHDAAACALAEHRWGAGQGLDRIVYLTCGTGFGAGIVIDGEPYYGSSGATCEVGHVRIRDDGPIAFGRGGSAEALCSARALGRIATWKFPARFPEGTSSEEIASLAREGDAAAAAVVELNAAATGEACGLLADVLAPRRILLGALSRHLGSPWLEIVRASFRASCHPRAHATCEVMPAGLGERLQDLSALVAATRAVAARA